jgi:AAHS family 4-hydroxybenzoate transporter-like MFS transporter
MFTGFNLGSGFVGFLVASLIPNLGWRPVLQVVSALAIVLVPILAGLLPESARFMVLRGRSAARIGAVLGRICGTSFPTGTQFETPEPPLATRTPLRVLVSGGYGAMTVALWITYFMGLLVIYLLTGWLPTMMKDAGLSISTAANITALFQIAGTVGAILVGWAMDRARPTRVIAIAYVAGAACIIGVAAVGPLSAGLAVMVAAAGFCMSGGQTGLNAFAPGCYPTLARATGVSWMLGMGRFGSIFGSYIGGVLLSQHWGFAAIFSLLAVPAVLAGVAVLRARRVTEPAVLPDARLVHT